MSALKTYLGALPERDPATRRAWWMNYAEQRGRDTRRTVYVFMPEGHVWWIQFEAPEPRERQADEIINYVRKPA